MADNNKIDIQQFCAIQGVSEADEFVMIKRNIGVENKTYKDWHEELSENFSIGEKKDFEPKNKVKEEVKK